MEQVINYKCLVFGSKEQLESIELRREILRVPLGLDFSEEELKSEKNQIHLAAVIENKLIGILLLKPFSSEYQHIKMRQVAVNPQFQGRGIGKALVEYSEVWSLENNFNTIELHARESAVPFYLKMNYQKIGKRFTEVNIPHYKMKKTLF